MIFTTFALQTSWQVVLTPDKEESGKSGVTSETLKNCIDRIYYTYIYIYINDIINVIYLFYAYIWRYMYISIYIYTYVHDYMCVCMYMYIYNCVYIYDIYLYIYNIPKSWDPPKSRLFFHSESFSKDPTTLKVGAFERWKRPNSWKGGTVHRSKQSMNSWVFKSVGKWAPLSERFFFPPKS